MANSIELIEQKRVENRQRLQEVQLQLAVLKNDRYATAAVIQERAALEREEKRLLLNIGKAAKLIAKLQQLPLFGNESYG